MLHVTGRAGSMAKKSNDKNEPDFQVSLEQSSNNQTKFVLCITGMPGSGKSTVAECLKKKGFSVINMGDVVRDEVKRRNIEPTDMNLGNLMLRLRKDLGPGAVAHLIVDEIQKMGTRDDDIDKFVIDGIRSVQEVEVLQSIGRVKLLAIHASVNTRYDHLKKRARDDAPVNEYDFSKRDKREMTVGIGEAITMADEIVSNNGLTIEELEQKAVKVIEIWLEEFYSDNISAKDDRDK